MSKTGQAQVEILALVPHLPMRLSNCLDRFFAFMRAFLFVRKGLLHLLEPLFRFAVVSGIVDHVPIGESCKVHNPQVNADIFVGYFSRLSLYLTREHHIPALSLSFDGSSLDLALDRNTLAALRKCCAQLA